METLESYGMRKIGFWSLSNHKSTKHLIHMHGIQFNLQEEVGAIRNTVYAFVSNNRVLCFGETSAGLSSRFQGYRYGNPLETDTDNRIKKEITSLLELGEEVTIWFTAPIGYLPLPNGEELEIPACKPLEGEHYEFVPSAFEFFDRNFSKSRSKVPL